MFIVKRVRSSLCLYLTFLCLLSLNLTACPHGFSFKKTCTVESQVYVAGESVPASDNCNSCECTEDGLVCTLEWCEPPTCEELGHQPGETWIADDGCNSCSCEKDGLISCTEMACPPPVGCEVDGEIYQIGETFGPCDLCTCLEGGIACLDMECPEEGCQYNGEHYEVGDWFEAADGCNSCSCDDNNQVSCTEMACPPPPPVGCKVDGAVYQLGETFGECDECQCLENNEVVCADVFWCPPEEHCELDGVIYYPGDAIGECGECTCESDGEIICAEPIWCPPVCEPSEEVCDGVDNDCDGEVDEDSVCCPMIIAPQDPCMNCYCTEDGWTCDDSNCQQECIHNDEVYFVGEIFGECGECECHENGLITCADVECNQPLSCKDKDHGETFTQGCLECTCLSPDLFVCIDKCEDELPLPSPEPSP